MLMKQKDSVSHKYITKCNYEKSHGYWVRVPEIEDGIIQPRDYQANHEFFRKGKGTWKAALEKATTWRDAYLTKHNAMSFLDTSNTRNNRKPRHNFSSNSSGVIGVPRICNIKLSGVYYSYKAIWNEDGKQRYQSFSILKYGAKGAFQYACLVRFKHAGTLIVTDKKMVKWLPEGVEYILQ